MDVRGEVVKGSCSRLSVCGLGVGLGVSWAFGVLVLGILSAAFGYGTEVVHLLSSVYKGYVATPLGIVIGTLWAFFDGFIAGVVMAWIYNLVVKSHHCKMCCTKDDTTL